MTKIHCGDFTCKYRKQDGNCSVKEIALEPMITVPDEHKSYLMSCKAYEPSDSFINFCEGKQNEQ